MLCLFSTKLISQLFQCPSSLYTFPFISFPHYSEVKWKSRGHVRLFATPWAIQSIQFSRPEYWSGQLFPCPGNLPKTGIEPRSAVLQTDSLPAEPLRKPIKSQNLIPLQCHLYNSKSCLKQSFIQLLRLKELCITSLQCLAW